MTPSATESLTVQQVNERFGEFGLSRLWQNAPDGIPSQGRCALVLRSVERQASQHVRNVCVWRRKHGGRLGNGAGRLAFVLWRTGVDDSSMPTADADSTIHALFGQFDMGVVLADRTGIRIGRDDSTGFLADYTTLKATSRYDIIVHEPGDSSNARRYVALKTVAA